MMQATAERYGGIDVLYNNAGISPPDDAGILQTPVDAWERVLAVNATRRLPLLQARHPAPARARRRLRRQRRVVRRARRRRDVADLVHGVEGRCARSEPRARRAVRPAGDPRERALPGPVETPLLQRIWGDDPEAAQRRLVHIPAGRLAQPRRDRQCRALPRERRIVVCQRRDLPRRRRRHGCVRHAGIACRSPALAGLVVLAAAVLAALAWRVHDWVVMTDELQYTEACDEHRGHALAAPDPARAALLGVCAALSGAARAALRDDDCAGRVPRSARPQRRPLLDCRDPRVPARARRHRSHDAGRSSSPWSRSRCPGTSSPRS